jgi:hypothetical protein
LEKWLGATSSIYTVLGSIKYALNSLPITSVNNLSLEYYTQSAGASSISVNASQAPGLSQLLLTDNTNGATTDLLLSAYNFTADAGTTSGRFTISARKISTALEPILLENGANTYTISLQNGGLVFANILPSNIVRVYDALGRMVANKTANGNSLEIKLNARGIYTVQFQSGTSVSARKVIL